MSALFARRFALTVAPLLVMGGVVLMAIFGDHGLVRRHELRQQRAEIGRRIHDLELDNAASRRQVRVAETYQLGVRRLAAEELRLAPPGSTIYVFEEP